MIRNFQQKNEEKHMESLYCLMNINTEQVKSKKIISCHIHPPSPSTKIRVWHCPPPPPIQDPICYVNFFYEYKVMLMGNRRIKVGWFKKEVSFFHWYNDNTYDFSSQFPFNNEWNLTRILQNSSEIAEKQRSWLFLVFHLVICSINSWLLLTFKRGFHGVYACDGNCIWTENAYHSGHLVPSLF